jgi:eukaryotic-like serine/threonine-protein kinase
LTDAGRSDKERRLAAGARLGPYEVLAPVGAGGMGEVYRARDERLGREVAIKILPPDYSSDHDRLRRFEQEAKAAGALNHPNLLAVFDAGLHAGNPYVVFELLEGTTLRQRLGAGPLPVRKAVDYADQIASGLAAAHEKGIVHRDVKPENLFLLRDGRVKILDFGLAKLRPDLEPAPRGPDGAAVSTATGAGVVLGTVGYMSPEQVKGEAADPRSDIFSFGVVLYEMLSGRRAFGGDTAAEVMTAILKDDPPELANADIPPGLERVVRRCLEKRPEERFQSARDIAFALEAVSAGAADTATRELPRFGRVVSLLPWAIAAVAVAAGAVAVRRSTTPAAPAPIRFSVALSGVDRLPYDLGRSLALLPDGSGFAYVGGRGNDPRIHLHAFGDGTSHPVSGTDGAGEPFFSPDGRWLGFFQGDKLKKMAVGGGPAIVICAPLENDFDGASWGPDEQIVFGGTRGLRRVPAAGGEAQALTTPNTAQGEVRHSAPHILPGGKTVLFTVLSKTGAMDDAAIAVLSLSSGERRVLIKGGANARYARSGHLVYVRGADLLAVPFDPDRLALTGSASLAVPDVLSTPQYLYGQFDVSATGTLVYAPGGATLDRSLVWVDRKGAVRPIPVPPRPYFHPSLLPSEDGVIVEIEETPHNIWRGDIRSGTLTRLTDVGGNHRPVLSPDGRFMAFSSDRVTPRSLFLQATDGSGTAQRLLEASHPHNATSWSPDGRWLAFVETHPDTKDDIWILPLEGDRRARPFLRTPSSERSATFSPDAQWLAYTSDESGREEVLIAAFPGPGPRKQVSTAGGEMPVFSKDGRKLFYRLGDQVLVADLTTQPSLTSGAPRVAFQIPAAKPSSGLPNFAVTSTGDSILTLRAVESESGPPRVQVVINWFQELRRLTAVK